MRRRVGTTWQTVPLARARSLFVDYREGRRPAIGVWKAENTQAHRGGGRLYLTLRTTATNSVNQLVRWQVLTLGMTAQCMLAGSVDKVCRQNGRGGKGGGTLAAGLFSAGGQWSSWGLGGRVVGGKRAGYVDAGCRMPLRLRVKLSAEFVCDGAWTALLPRSLPLSTMIVSVMMFLDTFDS